MMNILESFWDKPIIAGYALSSFKWWLGILIFIAIHLVVAGLYFLFIVILGYFKFKDEDKEKYNKYKEGDKQTRKEMKGELSSPVKSTIRSKRTLPWAIPVTVFVSLMALTFGAVWPVAGEQLLVTIFGSPVRTIDTEASRKAAEEASVNVVTIEEEGIVLLKNENNVLPLNVEENNKVNIFGSCAFGMMFGNGGSGTFATNYDKNGVKRIATRFNEAMVDEEIGFEYNQHLYNVVANNFKRKGTYTAADPGDYKINCGVNTYNYAEIVSTCVPYEYEVPAAQYKNASLAGLDGKSLLDEAKEYSNTAIYCISRYGTESKDMNTSDMQLKTEEVNMINMIKENFEKVIILLNVPQTIEAGFLDDPLIDSALFVGHPGLTGTKAIAEVLAGKVNPSGKLVDTWAYDAKSAPSYQSFGNDTTLTYSSGRSGSPFVEFKEGIYVGYRYYVTRAKTDDSFDYNEAVQYSFGHGLSYTTFETYIDQYKVDKTNEKVEITVGVKNTGDVKGKQVIEVYTNAPYYPGGIEKSYYSLQEFAKTSELEPNELKYYKIEFDFRDMASWSTEKGCYVLEHGDYEISLRKNVWDEETSTTGRGSKFTINIANDIEYKTSAQTGYEFENIFDDVEHGPCEDAIVYLSRNDWAGTFPDNKTISRAAIASNLEGGKALNDWNFADNQIEGDAPTTNAGNNIELADLKDADWDDPKWETLLDNLSRSEMQDLIDNGGFKTSKVTSINKRESKDYDGPASAFHSGTGHPSEVVLASSWNRNIAEIMGNSIGKEGAARGITGWYAPGINIHRSPYGGRNFEYYSEDPLFSGQMAGYTSIGLSKYGVYAYAKHFALNEQENQRENLYCWASEQSIREIYARGFEHYVNLGGLGLMTSFNKVGSYWAGASEALLTKLLRNEWGFHGVVVTDYCYNSTMGANVGLRAGNDLWLLKNGSYGASYVYSKTPNDAMKLFRRACKNILYACAHSNNVWTEEDYAAVGIDEIIIATDRS